MNQINPLQQYFRQPAIYIRLPSQGKFYPAGAIDYPDNGELPVFPMTAVDEITYRTPDALFNGQATVNVIESCVPNIKNGWAIPSMDIDTLLVAIRMASYGNSMDFGTSCPKCQEPSDRALDLNTALASMRTPDYSTGITAGDMQIFLRPMTYQNLNDNNRLQYDNQKMLQNLPNADIAEEEKMSALTSALKKITDITIKAIALSISAIKTPQALVTESEFIEEWLHNCDKAVFTKVRERVVELKSMAEMQPMKMSCPSCSHEYDQMITLDMTSFFGADS